MKQIDRNFYDMKKRVSIQEYGLDLINGFATSIASYENQLLLCAEITHKLLHRTTVFELMGRLYQDARDHNLFRERCTTELVGRIVMTRYNDKTYQINDISWDVTPSDAFETTRGDRITFIEYYQRVSKSIFFFKYIF